jgi:hypothetical protein
MDELNIEEFKLLVSHYNKRATDAELKNAELQLILGRLKNVINIHESQIKIFESKIGTLESENFNLSEIVKELSVKKSTAKAVKAKE